MSDGEISGNTAGRGGGVYVSLSLSINSFYSGNMSKTGGTIYGYTGGDNSNTAKSSGVVQSNQGHAVYAINYNSSIIYRRETTAGPTVNLDSNVAGAAGGWE